MMSTWETNTVAECLRSIRVNCPKLQTAEYKQSGLYPVIDQGQNFISGWTDNEAAVISSGLPIVVFGDHTRIFKYVDIPFARGADGTQLLCPKSYLNPRFFYYSCKAIHLDSRGYNRHFKALKESEIQFPRNIEEQQAIATLLYGMESLQLINQKKLAASVNLKHATMHKLFTCGLRGESQKETEIGLVPESWDPTAIDNLATKTQYGLSLRGHAKGQYPILRMNCQVDGKVEFRDLQYVDIDDDTFVSFKVKYGDILFNRTNSIEHVGRTAIYNHHDDAVFASYLVRLSVNAEKCIPEFINYYMNWPTAQKEIKKMASRAVGQANINATKLRTSKVPLPQTIEEQQDIVDILDAIDQKIDLHRRKKAVLEELFKSLLHKLMTGEIRVDDLDLSALEPV